MASADFFETFRAQLVLPEQRQIFDYWRDQAGHKSMPDRADISPAQIPRHLPFVSLIDIDHDAADFRYRLAGTQLREIFGREVTNLSLSGFREENHRDYWCSACERLARTGRPAQGILRGPEASRDHMVQYWLRLPLSNGSARPALILGYDKCIAISETDLNQSDLEPSLVSTA